MSLPKTKLAEVRIPPKKPQKYLFHVPRTTKDPIQLLSGLLLKIKGHNSYFNASQI